MFYFRKYLYIASVGIVILLSSLIDQYFQRMSCSNCTKSFSLFTREHGCPGCGFSVCSGCLKQTMTVKDKQQRVCNKCFSRAKNPQSQQVLDPPKALQNRMEKQPLPRILSQPKPPTSLSTEDQKIAARLRSLQEERSCSAPSSDQVRERLDKLKDLPAGSSRDNSPAVFQKPDTRTNTERTSDIFRATQAEVDLEARLPPVLTAEQDIERRLAKLRGENIESLPSRQHSNLPDPEKFLVTSEEPQPHLDLENVSVDDVNKLMQEVDKKMKLDAENAMKELEKDKTIQEQLERLRVKSNQRPGAVEADRESEESDEEPSDLLLAKILAEARLEDRLSPLPQDGGREMAGGEPEELPWCVICNEDAVVRCRDCEGDLYCGGCFAELHSDRYDRSHRTERFKSAK